MQRSFLRQHVYDLIGQDAETAVDSFGTPRVDRQLQAATIHVARFIQRLDAEEVLKTATFATVVDTREYNLLDTISDFADLVSLEIENSSTNDRPITVKVDRVLHRGRRGVGNSAYLRGFILGFYAVPKSVKTFTVLYTPNIPDYSKDEDNLDNQSGTFFADLRIRDEFQAAIYLRAAYLLLLQEGSEHRPIQAEFEREMQSIKLQLQGRIRGPRFMNVTSRVAR